MLDKKSNDCGAFLVTKYSNELKAKVVSEYLKGGIGYRELSVRYGIPSRANIRTWVNQARTHGIESLKVKHNKATYSQTFKITVVEYVHTHQVSRVQAAAHFGISPSQVNSWIRIVKAKELPVYVRSVKEGRLWVSTSKSNQSRSSSQRKRRSISKKFWSLKASCTKLNWTVIF
ncbi:helix-turn-helix domain-containing protein [Schleiferilactobacillus harbinensis]|nr:helix-turn-helix domain-containing protein [Schleiferilactobacillus harbinensis]QFR63759.1 helix-turn-helix domain-containing protein [Schleiferilactobacillus harbinensis]